MKYIFYIRDMNRGVVITDNDTVSDKDVENKIEEIKKAMNSNSVCNFSNGNDILLARSNDILAIQVVTDGSQSFHSTTNIPTTDKPVKEKKNLAISKIPPEVNIDDLIETKNKKIEIKEPEPVLSNPDEEESKDIDSVSLDKVKSTIEGE